MSLAFLFHYLMLNMFRMLIHPFSGVCNLFVELCHGLYCSGMMRVGVTLWFGWAGVVSGCRLKHYYSTIKMMYSPINIRKIFIFPCFPSKPKTTNVQTTSKASTTI